MKKSEAFFLFLLFFWVVLAEAADYGFTIKNAKVNPADSGFVLDADIDYRFSHRSMDALKHGVPLTLVVKVRLSRYRGWIWNQSVFNKNLVYRLSYHALRKRYRVFDENSGIHQYHANLESALRGMGKIRGLLVLSSAELVPDSRYIGKLMAYLDIEALPLPLRSVAFLVPQWYINSGWYTWTIDGLGRR